MTLPIKPPFAPMEALSVDKIPEGPMWQYEPKWDGFRCLVFKDKKEVELQSKAGQPLGRYFPEIVEAFTQMPAQRFVLDGELAIPVADGLSFDDLLLRLHPAATRVKKLAEEHPALFIAFDILVNETGDLLVEKTLKERRIELERFAKAFFKSSSKMKLSPAASAIAQAKKWFAIVGDTLDGIIAKRVDFNYRSGDRTGMQKIKNIRTVDCVVGGFRYATGRRIVGSLLLGLYDGDRLLHHVGFTSGIKSSEKPGLTARLESLIEEPGFSGRSPGGPSRWNSERSTEWKPLRPNLVVEVSYDHFTGGRFRHGTKLLRWRPDKSPKQCKMDQVSAQKSKSVLLLK